MLEMEGFTNKYELGRSRGSGAFGNVYEVTVRENGEKRAVKIIEKENIINSFLEDNDLKEPTKEQKIALFEEVNEEIKIMEKVEGKNKENKNTVKFYEKLENENQIVIIMELCDNDLLKFVSKNGPFNDKEIYELLTQLNNTFKIMYENKIYHRDLSLNNILIKIENDKKIYKLSDYGASKKLATLKNNFQP